MFIVLAGSEVRPQLVTSEGQIFWKEKLVASEVSFSYLKNSNVFFSKF